MLKIKNIAISRQNITPAVKYVLFGLFIVLASSFCIKKHPYYIGLTEITYNSGKPNVQISVRLFANDLEDALRKTSGKALDIINPKNKTEVDSILLNYIKKRLVIILNTKVQSLNYVGYEKEEESIWAYLEIKSPKPPKQLIIDNKLLYDYLPQQTNIIRVNINDVTTSKKLNNPDHKTEFSF